MKNLMKITAILLIVAGSFVSCEKKEVTETVENKFLTELNSATLAIVPKESLPEWLVARINDYYETRPSSLCKVLIYRGEWNKQTVYFILDTYSACLCDFFTNAGERIVENLSDCRATSKNWVLIYEYGDFVLDLDELFSN